MRGVVAVSLFPCKSWSHMTSLAQHPSKRLYSTMRSRGMGGILAAPSYTLSMSHRTALTQPPHHSSKCLYSTRRELVAVPYLSQSYTTSLTLQPPNLPSRRPYSTRRGKLSSLEDAKKFLVALPVPQRMCLEKAVMEAIEEKAEPDVVTPPTWKQLKLLCYQYALPFVGFGFLDNFIMITVGEYIDLTLGAALSISTMAAAGIGNLISDLAGLGLADRVEALCKWLGLPDPKLSQAQLQHRASRWMGLLGRCLGIIVGCTIGMAPLIWFTDTHKPEPGEEESDHDRPTK